MWSTAQIETDEYDDLPASRLHLDLLQIDAATAEVEQESFSFVGGLKRQDFGFAAHRKVGLIICYAVFFHRD